MAIKNSWFKHYNTSSDGQSFELLWAAQDYEAIAFFWWLLEQVSRFESLEERGKCTLSYSLLKRKLGWNAQRSARVLSKIASSFQVKIEPCSDKELFQVSIPNWLKLQENRGGKTLSKKEQNPERSKKREVRGKKKEIDYEKFQRAFELFPIQIKGPKAEERFAEQIQTDDDFADLLTSLQNYVAYLSRPENSWRAPKQSFETFLGTKNSGYFWRTWIKPVTTQIPSQPTQKKTDWTHEAQIIFQACKTHGFSAKAIEPVVGTERVNLLRKAGGAHSLGQMPDNQFTIKELAGKLKAAAELLAQGQAS
jgi:hypothetical protein